MKRIITTIVLTAIASLGICQSKPKKYVFRHVDTIYSFTNKSILVFKLKSGKLKRLVIEPPNYYRIDSVDVYNSFNRKSN